MMEGGGAVRREGAGSGGSTSSSVSASVSLGTAVSSSSSRVSRGRASSSAAAQARVEKTAATADRIAQLVATMHSKLEKAEADKEMLSLKAEEDCHRRQELESQLHRLDDVDRRSEKIDLIASRMREETRRIRQREAELDRREVALNSLASASAASTPQQQHHAHPQSHPHPHGPSVGQVRAIYEKIASLEASGVATRSALLRALQTDGEVRALFHDEGSARSEVHLQRLFESCSGDPSGGDHAISWAEFSLTVLGPAHPGLPEPSAASPYSSSTCGTPESEAMGSAPSELPDPSPPPPRHPELSPTLGMEAASSGRAPSPSSRGGGSSAMSSSVSAGCPQSRSASPPESGEQIAAMAEILSAADVDPRIDPSSAVRVAVAHGRPFVDVAFPPSPPSASPGCAWERVSTGSLHLAEQLSCAAVSGICSDRLFLSCLCLLADGRRMVPQGTADLREGHAVAHVAGCATLVDTFFPSIDMCPVYASAGPSQVWLMLAEKAFAKQKGGYAQMEQCRSSLAEVVEAVCPGSAVAAFPMSGEGALPDLVESCIAGHLQLLVPLPTAASKLADIGAAYTVQALWPPEEVHPAHLHVLLWCPVMSQGDASVDARWVAASELPSLFGEWVLVDLCGEFARRRETCVALPGPPAIAARCGGQQWGEASGAGSSEPWEGAAELPGVAMVEAPVVSLPSRSVSAVAEQSRQSRAAEVVEAVGLGAGAGRGGPVEQHDVKWDEVLCAAMQSNTAVVREVQVHREEAAKARRERDELEEERVRLRAALDSAVAECSEWRAQPDVRQERDDALQRLGEAEHAGGELREELALMQEDAATARDILASVLNAAPAGSLTDAATEARAVLDSALLKQVDYELTSDDQGQRLAVFGTVWRDDASLAELRQNLEAAEVELSAGQRVADEMADKVADDRQQLEQQNSELRADNARCKSIADVERANVLQLTEHVAALRSALDDELRKVERLSTQLKSATEAHERVEKLEADLQLAVDSNTEKDAKIEGLSSQVEQLEDTSERMLTSAHGEAHRKITESVGQVLQLQESVEDALKSADERYDDLNTQFQSLRAQHATAEEELTCVRAEVQKGNDARGDIEQELKITLTQLELQKEAHIAERNEASAASTKMEGELAQLRERSAADRRQLEDEMPRLQDELRNVTLLHQELATKHLSVVREMEQLRAQSKQPQCLDLTAAEVDHLYSELARAEEKIATLEGALDERERDKDAMAMQVHTARVEITELLREVSERPSREGSASRNSLAYSQSVEPHRHEAVPAAHDTGAVEATRLLEAANAALREENARLQDAPEQLAVACDQLNTLQAELAAANERAAASEARRIREAAAATVDGRHKELQLSNDLLQRELQVATDQVARLTEEIQVREQRLEQFAADTAALQARMQELLGMAACTSQGDAERAALEEELKEAKEAQRQVAAKWRRVATSLQETKRDLEAQRAHVAEYEDAMQVAGREIQALHKGREEQRRAADEERTRASVLLEEQVEENRELRLEMLKVISERNALHSDLYAGEPVSLRRN